MATELYIGTSGYSYSDWVGPVYPQGTDRTKYLEIYATRFSAVELNFSYYRQPDAAMLERMIERTPDSFRFAIKAHKSLTHVVEDDWKSDAQSFLAGIQPLVGGGRLIAVLLQFPFSFHYTTVNRVYLDSLCESLSSVPLSVEFRNAEWHTDRVLDALRDRDVGYAVADYPELDGLPRIRAEGTSSVGYVRFHGRNRENWWTGTNASRYDYLYSDDEIEDWIERIRAISSKTKIMLAVFNNHWRGQAVSNATMLKKKLETIEDLELSVLHPDKSYVPAKADDRQSP